LAVKALDRAENSLLCVGNCGPIDVRKVMWVEGDKRRSVVYLPSRGTFTYKIGATRFRAWLSGAEEVKT